MKTITTLLTLSTLATLTASAEPALTIYNQNFAVVRDTVGAQPESRAQRSPLRRRHRAGGTGIL